MEIVWYVRYSTECDERNGMIVSRDGEIVGADRAHTYTGTYKVSGTHVSAAVFVTPSHEHESISNSSESVRLILAGTVKDRTALLHGHLDHHPEIDVTVELQCAVEKRVSCGR